MKLQIQDLLGAQRAVYVLAEKPGTEEADTKHFWYLKLGGIHHEHLKSAVADIRKQKLKSAKTKSQERALKSKSLQDSLAKALGAKSYDHWLAHEQPKLEEFLANNGLVQPADLIKWTYYPGYGSLKTRQISDRLFNSGLPLPRRIFTGVGSHLFAPSGYGRLDIDTLAGRSLFWDQERYDFCLEHADTVLLRATQMRGADGPTYMDLTGRTLMLNAVSEYVGGMYNLLGSNLTDPAFGNTVMCSYNTSEADRAFDLQIFKFFREEIEKSECGWVEVLEVPGNENLIFLKGPNGTFDWVVRDQRDAVLSSNPLYPFFDKNELPKAMDASKLTAHLYFTPGKWQEKLEHDAETRHYEQGGTTANWPGYEKLIERELNASSFAAPTLRDYGRASDHFVSHRISGYRLMVSPLITIDEFKSFMEKTGWEQIRLEKAQKAKVDLEPNLMSLNFGDSGDLPVSVTWLDAVAYCRDYEARHDLPVRLLDPDEWQQIAPPPSIDRSKVNPVRSITVKSGEMPIDPIYEEIGWAVVGGDGKLGKNSSHCYMSDGVFSFGSNLHWTSNSESLPFLSSAGFLEWLSGYQNGRAPFANPRTAEVRTGAGAFGPLEPAHLAMKHEGAKFGFRLCYVAHPDS